MPITPLPTPPSRADAANFAARADAFFGALPTFVAQFNAELPYTTVGLVNGNFAVTGGSVTQRNSVDGSDGLFLKNSAGAGLGALYGSGASYLVLQAGADVQSLRLAAVHPDAGVRIETSGSNRLSVHQHGYIGINGNTNGIIGGAQHQLAMRFIGGGVSYGFGLQALADDTIAMSFINAAGTTCGSIYITATTTSYNTVSDRRLKTQIAPAADPGALLDQVHVVSHGWAALPDSQVRWGFVAQELAQVFPEAVTVGDDFAVPGDDDFRPWAVDPSKLVPVLLAELQHLRRRVAALEAHR